ncbi:MAG: hypothetical protein F6K47_21120 [Symploca sp. SIO2E6]|nr:hypothetical protein [Symploca sp. SIO2E6]
MNKKVYLAYIISYIPVNFLRILFYRIFLNYQISGSSRIGMFTVITVDKATITDSNIGKFNRFSGPYTLEIDEGSTIGDKNDIVCGEWVLQFKDDGYLRTCRLGKNTKVTSLHFIDVAGGFELDDNSWIGGRQSQFWTHGPNAIDRAIAIGKDCYIASGVKFAPGTLIGNSNIVGLGSVVTKKFNVENSLIVGSPAKVIKENYNWQELYLKSHRDSTANQALD